MEAEAVAAENAFVEGGILWLAQTIVESTSNGKLGEWIQHAELGEGMEKLTSEIQRVETVVAHAKGRANRNKPLARLLASIKELLYDADDLVDDLDYYRLKEQVEGGAVVCVNDPERTNGDGDETEQVDANEPEGRDGNGDQADQVEGSNGNPADQEAPMISGSANDKGSKKRKNQCSEWDHFTEIRDANGKRQEARCKYCLPEVKIKCANGTSGLRKHSRSNQCQRNRPAHPTSATDDAVNGITDATRDSFREKRMRIVEASTHNAASNTWPWDKDEFSNTIHQIVSELQGLRGEVCEFLKDSVACSDQCQSNTDTRIRSSSLAPRKVHGRDVEQEYIIRVIRATEAESITVLPIVGIVGVGKTAVAQLVYNDPAIESEFERIWVWVSDSFDEVRLTREMLDAVSLESHEGSPHNIERHERIDNYSKLQEILKKNMGCRSKRFLLVLDDVSDRMDNTQWKQLLAPLESSDKKGNVIVITTRSLSVARRLGTAEPIKLGALGNDDFWLMFKACAFGDDSYEGHPSLTIIGRQIAAKLMGNPLAAKTAGEVLNEHLTIDHWSRILKREDWKSMQAKTSIMRALKHSYDKLPYPIQQCFLYCSIFPNNYMLIAEDLVFTWIAQGFISSINSGKTPEEIGWYYLNRLVDLCFFEQVERKDSTLGNQLRYLMCGIVHDFARLISRTECAAIDGIEIECDEILPIIRHLSILTDSAFCKGDQHGSLCRNLHFEEKLQCVVKSAVKLRTLVLIGKYDSFFFRSFEEVFRKARYFRMLQVSATYDDLDSFMCKLVNSSHLRYLKLENKSGIQEFHMPLIKFYHLQILDIGHPTITSSINGLVGMRRLAVKKGPHVTDQHSVCFEVLQSMNDLVHLGMHQLQNVNGEEICGAKLRDKQHLENLDLSWEDASSQDGYGSNTSSEHYTDTEPEEDNWPMNGANNILIAEPFTGTSKEVLEGLEPYHNLKHLRISGYSGATSANWLVSAVSVTSLQTLHLEDCKQLQVLPSLESFPLLTKLKLKNMTKVRQVSIPSLEELVLIEMPKLKRCSSSSLRGLNSSLRVLMIERCYVLEAFTLFDSCENLRIEHKSWLSNLSKLTIQDCSQLIVSNPLPPSSSNCELSISGVSTFPDMEGSSNGELIIGLGIEGEPFFDELTKLDEKVLSFHNLRTLTRLKIGGFQNLLFISLEGFKQLISLKSLEIIECVEFFSSDVLPEHAHEDTETPNFNAFPALKHLSIRSYADAGSNKIFGNWLSVMLRHAPILEELHLDSCEEISYLSLEGKESCFSNHNSTPRASSLGNTDDASTSSAPEGLVHIPSNLVSSLKKLSIAFCSALTFLEENASFSAFTSLEELEIRGCPGLVSSFVPKDENSGHANEGCLLSYSPGEPGIVELESLQKLQLCPRMSLNCLKKLELGYDSYVESLQLDSFTTLEELIIEYFDSLIELEGLQSLRGLRYFKVSGCPGLPPFLEGLSGQVSELLFPRLERLHIDDYSFLTTSFCMHLTSLQRLQLNTWWLPNKALQLLMSLQEVEFSDNFRLVDLPLGLHSLSSLKRLRIISCPSIFRLPEKGLPPSLEELEISGCSKELTGQCRARATSMLKVKIDGEYVN